MGGGVWTGGGGGNGRRNSGLAYPRDSMPELVKDGESGYLVDTEDEMVEAIYRIERLDRRRCRDWVQENFSVEQMVEGYERLYCQIAGDCKF